jgi:hypothetical protein
MFRQRIFISGAKIMDSSKNFEPSPSPITSAGSMGFDIGFDMPEATQLEHQLGVAIIPYENAQESLGNQVNSHLMATDTKLKMVQGDLGTQVYNNLNNVQTTLTGLQQDIEAKFAGQMGGVLETAERLAQVVPNPYTKPSGQKPGQDPDYSSPEFFKGLPIPGADKPSGVTYDPTKGICPTLKALGLVFETNTRPTSGGGGTLQNMVLNGTDGKKYRISWAYVESFPGHWTLRSEVKSEFDLSEWYLEPPFECADTTNVIPIPPVTPPGIPPDKPPTDTPPSVPPTTPSVPPVRPPTTPPTQPCIKLCPADPVPCVEKEYDVWCNGRTGQIIVVEKGQPRPSGTTQLLSSGPVSRIDWAAVAKCSKPQTTPPTNTPPMVIPAIGVEIPGCTEFGSVPGVALPNGVVDFSRMFGIRREDGTLNTPDAGPDAGIIANAVIRTVTGVFASAVDLVGKVITSLVTKSGCTSGAMMTMGMANSLLSFLQKFFGSSWEFARIPIQQQQQFLCPTDLPSKQDATSAWLGNTIDYGTFECWVRADNGRFPEWERVVEANRTKLTADQTVALWYRRFINDGDYETRIRELGFTRPNDAQDLLNLAVQIPSISDLVPFMIRDTADEVNVDWSKSDETFEQKWTGQIKLWGDKQAINKDYMKYVWRAHWTLPSPTQLFEFWRRLRHTGKFGTPDEVKAKIKQTLVQQDILPNWVDYYLAVANNPLTRTDAKRAYSIGSLDEAGLKSSFLDGGYDDKNAQILTNFTKKQVELQFIQSNLIGQYIAGAISKKEAVTVALYRGMSQDLVPKFEAELDFKLRIKRRSICVKAYRQRYLIGEIDNQQAKTMLFNEGLDAVQLDDIVAGWACEKANRGKEIPARKLAQWFELGVIDQVEFYRRMINLGYSDDNAAKVIVEARTRLGIRQSKDEQQRIAQLRREAAADARKQKQLIAAVVATQTKDQAKADKMRQIREKRDKLLIEAGDKFSKTSGMPLAEAIVGIKKIIQNLIGAGLSTIDNTYTGAVEVAKNPEVITLDDFVAALADLLTAVEA